MWVCISPFLSLSLSKVKSVSWTGLRGKSLAKRQGFKDLHTPSKCSEPPHWTAYTLIHPHSHGHWTDNLFPLENVLLGTVFGSASPWFPSEGYTVHQHQDHTRWEALCQEGLNPLPDTTSLVRGVGLYSSRGCWSSWGAYSFCLCLCCRGCIVLLMPKVGSFWGLKGGACFSDSLLKFWDSIEASAVLFYEKVSIL